MNVIEREKRRPQQPDPSIEKGPANQVHHAAGGGAGEHAEHAKSIVVESEQAHAQRNVLVFGVVVVCARHADQTPVAIDHQVARVEAHDRNVIVDVIGDFRQPHITGHEGCAKNDDQQGIFPERDRPEIAPVEPADQRQQQRDDA